MNESLINIGIYVTYGLVAIAALSAILFPIIQLFWNFRKSVPGLVGIAVLVIIVLISYSISTNEVYEGYGPNVSQWVSGGITTTFLLVGLGVVSALFTEIYKLFR